MNGRKIAALVLLIVIAAVADISSGGQEVKLDLSTSESCRACHEDVYAEWEESYHALSFVDPLVREETQSDNFRVLQCIPCHAPSPVLEHGIGKGARVVPRVAFRDEGINCLSCHKIHDQIAATRTVDAPCRPVEVPELRQAALCAPCHNQHETVDEWERSSFHAEGVSCLDCHMAPVERTLADGRSHVFPGSHDGDFLRDALTVEVSAAEEVLHVSLTNHGAGHNFPTDARHRALDLVVTLVTQDGLEVPARESRGAGQSRGTFRRRFRNPYRQEALRMTNLEQYGRENTQIHSGETIDVEVPFSKADIASARVEVIYKLTPIQEDEEGCVLFSEEVEL
jgi:nitrate/TMAO reductase-like tetraheme cytochrome c subunit